MAQKIKVTEMDIGLVCFNQAQKTTKSCCKTTKCSGITTISSWFYFLRGNEPK